MDEHTFDDGPGRGPLSDADATTLAADFAESLLDEVARPRHDWYVILLLARGVGQVATLMLPDRPPPA